MSLSLQLARCTKIQRQADFWVVLYGNFDESTGHQPPAREPPFKIDSAVPIQLCMISLASCDCFARQKNETSSWRSKTKSTLLKAYIPWVHLHILNLLNLKAFAAMGHIHSLCSKQSRCFPLASSATNFWEKVEKTLLKRHGESGTQERSGKLFSWRMAALLLRGVQWKVSLRKKHSPRGGRPMRST